MSQWASIRVYATQGIQPYSPQAWEAAGKLLPGYAGNQAPWFHYPLYSLVFILPFALIPDPVLAQALWMLLLEMALVALAAAAIEAVQWKLKPWSFFLLMVFAVVGLHSLLALASGSMGIVSALFGVAAIAALRTQRDELAGLALALATLQPEAIGLVLLLTLGWAFSNRRGKVGLWFFGGLVFLTVVGVFFIPDWPVQYLRTLLKFAGKMPLTSPLAAFATWWPGVGKQLGWVLSALAAAVVLVEWFLVRGKDYRWFLWTASLTIVLGQWTGIPTSIEYYAILIFPLVMVLATLDQRVEGGAGWLVPVSLVVLLVGLWAWFLRLLLSGSAGQLGSLFLFPLPLVLLLGLYWVRWWCVRPQRLYLDALKEYETRR